MIRTIIFFLFFLSIDLSAQIIEIRNADMQRDGLTPHTLKSWLMPSQRQQAYDGQYHANLFNKNLHDSGIRIFEKTYTLNTPSYFEVYIRPTCLHPELSDDFKLAFIVKILPEEFFEHTDKQDEKPNIAEIERVQSAESLLQGEEYARNYPHLALAVGHYKVETRALKTYYFSIYHAASGCSFRKLLENQDAQCFNGFKLLGRRLARFHLKNMELNTQYRDETLSKNPRLAFRQRNGYYKTYIHGDLSLNNVFYDAEKNRITFIDLETMGFNRSTQRQSILRDIEAFVMRLYFYEEGFVLSQKMRDFDDTFTMAMTLFFKTYIQSYPPDMQKRLKQYLGEVLTHHRVTSQIEPPFNYYESSLNRVRSGQFDELMENIRQNILDF